MSEPHRGVLWEVSGRTLWLTLDRPDRRNAISSEIREALQIALSRAESDREIDIVVLTGAGGVFCAGADTNELRQYASREAVAEMISANSKLREQWAGLSKPTVAAVDGPAYGLGFILALQSDYVVVTESARFCLPEARLGLPLSSVEKYVGRFGPQRANELAIACRVLSGREAEAWGLANHVAQDQTALREAVLDLAANILRTPGIRKFARASGTKHATSENK